MAGTGSGGAEPESSEVVKKKRKKSQKKNQVKWIKYTQADLDGTPLFVCKTGKHDFTPYPEEIQKQLRLQYKNMKKGEPFEDIEYPMTDQFTFRLRIIEEKDMDTYREFLGKWAVNDFVGMQWDASAKECNPPHSRGEKVTFRPIMEKEMAAVKNEEDARG